MTSFRSADTSIFDGVAAFSRHRGRALAPLARHADRVVLLPGVTIAREGVRSREVVMILSGTVEVRRATGRVDELGRGAVIGAREELDGVAHRATYVAGSGVEALVLTGAAFRWAVQALPDLGHDLGLSRPLD
jgi:CRP-like cAMP-binding protein